MKIETCVILFQMLWSPEAVTHILHHSLVPLQLRVVLIGVLEFFTDIVQAVPEVVLLPILFLLFIRLILRHREKTRLTNTHA